MRRTGGRGQGRGVVSGGGCGHKYGDKHESIIKTGLWAGSHGDGRGQYSLQLMGVAWVGIACCTERLAQAHCARLPPAAGR